MAEKLTLKDTIPIHIPTRPISFADIVKKGPTPTGGIVPHPHTKIP
jgi:hypothetical protein